MTIDTVTPDGAPPPSSAPGLPILAIGFLSGAGDRRNGQRLGAVTASNVFLFDYPTQGQTFTAETSPPMIWSRRGLVATVDAPRRLTQRLHVRLATGETLAYDLSNAPGEWGAFSDAMRDLLVHPPPNPVS